MAGDDQITTYHYKANGVVMGEYKRLDRSYFFVADENFAHYRITFSPRDREVSVGVDAAWSDEKPGQLARYSDDLPYSCSVEEILIDGEGFLSVMARKRTATHVDLRIGFSLKLSPAFIEPIQMAVTMLRDTVA